MRCRRIRFSGYKRLAKTECDVSPRLLAFVGQNESGKSSVLAGLEWLTEDDETPLDRLDASRANKKSSGWVVGADYEFDADDLALLEPLGFKTVPKGMSLWKQVSGNLHIVFDDPREVKRDPAPFLAAAAALQTAGTRLARQIEAAAAEYGDGGRPSDWIAAVSRLLEDSEHAWEADDQAVARELAEWLEETPTGGKRPRDAKTAELVRSAATLGAAAHPKETGLDIMRSRVPKFVLFKDEDRVLPTVTVINTRQAVASARPAVRNLLAVAGLDAPATWRAYAEGDSGEVETLLNEANERLDAFFGQAWNQSNISVRLTLNESGLHAHIYEIESRRFTRIEERSDGLRAFVALAVFLESQHLDVPPILLIDEAETHLHFDAQADLVGVLLKQVNASQVLYSTHSPGCLPSDLGTGIRLLKRTGDTSEIRSHFWTNEAPGFGSLLFAMGAGAAAFSVCRWAVLAEGPSEMILLPTLIRLVTGLDDLPYQIAPGLSNARAYDMQVEEVAARVVYLADGDGDGDRYLRDLRQAGVDGDRLFQFPKNVALEDLLDREFYFKVVAGLLPEGGPVPTPGNVGGDEPVARALQHWAAAQRPKVKMPGKVAVAYAVLDQDEIALSDLAVEVLRAQHDAFISAFDAAGRTASGDD
jgi:hypothetical protein